MVKKRSYLKYKICVSGAAETKCCSENALELAKEVGKQIAKNDAILVTGATSGIPFWSAVGAKKQGGIVIGFSPAASEKSHLKTYHLPTDYHDLVVYTGFEYSGRNLLLTRAADAIIVICGRLGTLNEFTIAFEDKKPIGVLTQSGGTADMIKDIVDKSHRGPGNIVYESEPEKLINKVIKLIDEEKSKNK
ncbi:hypothetical protein ACFLZ0_02445 [Patescibacteria group bacterium]